MSINVALKLRCSRKKGGKDTDPNTTLTIEDEESERDTFHFKQAGRKVSNTESMQNNNYQSRKSLKKTNLNIQKRLYFSKPQFEILE